MAIVRKRLYPGMELTPEQIEELRALENRPIVFDEDCPELTDAQLERAAAIARRQRREEQEGRELQYISLTVSPAVMEANEKYGEGALSRLLDLAIRDEALLKRCL